MTDQDEQGHQLACRVQNKWPEMPLLGIREGVAGLGDGQVATDLTVEALGSLEKGFRLVEMTERALKGFNQGNDMTKSIS